jgi:hypothetical protein
MALKEVTRSLWLLTHTHTWWRYMDRLLLCETYEVHQCGRHFSLLHQWGHHILCDLNFEVRRSIWHHSWDLTCATCCKSECCIKSKRGGHAMGGVGSANCYYFLDWYKKVIFMLKKFQASNFSFILLVFVYSSKSSLQAKACLACCWCCVPIKLWM